MEKEQEVKVIQIKLYCDECNEEMLRTGISKPMSPPLHEYECINKHTQLLSKSYPHIKYEDTVSYASVIDKSKYLGYLLVKVVKCTNGAGWYKDYIGHTMIVNPSNPHDFTLKLDEGSDRFRWIPRKDCEILSAVT